MEIPCIIFQGGGGEIRWGRTDPLRGIKITSPTWEALLHGGWIEPVDREKGLWGISEAGRQALKEMISGADLMETLYTQPHHKCAGQSRDIYLEPPHKGTDGRVRLLNGWWEVHPNADWILHVSYKRTPVNFCPWCGAKLEHG